MKALSRARMMGRASRRRVSKLLEKLVMTFEVRASLLLGPRDCGWIHIDGARRVSEGGVVAIPCRGIPGKQLGGFE